jgi:hypothetical protein
LYDEVGRGLGAKGRSGNRAACWEGTELDGEDFLILAKPEMLRGLLARQPMSVTVC